MDAIEKIKQLIKQNPENTKSVEFMKKAINTSLEFIRFDQTYNDEVYIEYVERKLASKPKEMIFRDLELAKNELINPKKVEEGKYKIPHKYLFDLIKKQEIDPICSLTSYFELDGQLNETYGKTIEELYEDPNYLLGMHASSSILDIEGIQNVLNEGLRTTTQGRGPGDLSSNVIFGCNLDFFRALEYIYHPTLPETIFLLKIPKKAFYEENPTPIFGSDNPLMDKNAHILPKYMYGYFIRKNLSEYKSMEELRADRNIIKSEHKNDKEYDYLFPEHSKYPIVPKEPDDDDARY